jgi:hypothetical protein
MAYGAYPWFVGYLMTLLHGGCVKCEHGYNYDRVFRSILVHGVFNDNVSTADVTYCEKRWPDVY